MRSMATPKKNIENIYLNKKNNLEKNSSLDLKLTLISLPYQNFGFYKARRLVPQDK